MKRLGLLPAIGIVGWVIATTIADHDQNRRLDALEKQLQTSGIRINGWDYGLIPDLFPASTNQQQRGF